MPQVTMRQLLETGVHFGHQTRRWNPKMKPYIFGERNGIYIIDLQKTLKKLGEAYDFMRDVSADGGHVLFVGTKKQAQMVVSEESGRCGQYFVNHRWLGGMLTNFATIKKSISRLEKLERMAQDGSIERLTKKEASRLAKEQAKLDKNLSGIRTMPGLPRAVFVVDPKKERIAVMEAVKLGIPVVGMADTNCDPSDLQFVIPGNDDAIRAVKLITGNLADAVLEGRAVFESKVQRDYTPRTGGPAASRPRRQAEPPAVEKPQMPEPPSAPGPAEAGDTGELEPGAEGKE